MHSLLPLQDAARSACISRTFLHSWRCHPKLILSKKTLGINRKACGKNAIARCFSSRVDSILKNHSGVGIKTLRLQVPDYYNVNTFNLNDWLQIAITPGIEEIAFHLPSNEKAIYNFPCSLLSDGRGNSIQYLYLSDCALCPSVAFDCLKNLTKLHLCEVLITGDELGCLISKSFALEQLRLTSCSELTCLKIPFCLERLSCLSVFDCYTLKVIESKTPNLSTFNFFGDPVYLSLGESSHVKILKIGFSSKPNSVGYAFTNLPSTLPNLETLTVRSMCEVHQNDLKHDSIFGDALHMRQISGHKHDRLKKVQINGFCSAKSMVELTCHILENATALESLTIDTIYNVEGVGNISRCCVKKKPGECSPVSRDMILEAHKALRSVKMYILERLPSTLKLNVGEPCTRCHAIDVKLP